MTRSRPTSEIFVLQIAQIGGAKLGRPEDPEGAWIDHDVFFDRDDADERARLHETASIQDAEGNDINAEVVTAVRVVTVDEIRAEFGEDREHQIMTEFRERIAELMDEVERAE